jgi:hypothetical protein
MMSTLVVAILDIATLSTKSKSIIVVASRGCLRWKDDSFDHA